MDCSSQSNWFGIAMFLLSIPLYIVVIVLARRNRALHFLVRYQMELNRDFIMSERKPLER